MQQGVRAARALRSSTCSRSTGEPLVDLPLDGAARAAGRRCSTSATGPFALSEPFDDGDALFEAAHGAAARGRSWPSGPTRATSRDGAAATGSRSRRRAGRSSSSPATRRGRAGAPTASARSCSASTRAAASAGPATSAPASTTPRSSGCSAKLKPLRRDDVAVRRGAEDAARAQGRRRLGRARRSSPRSASPSGRTTAGCGRRSTRGCARTRRRVRCTASERRSPEEIRRGKRVLKLSNLDKPFWPEEGITKGDLIAYYRDVAPVLVPHLQDRPFTMKRYPGRLERQVLLPEGRAQAHARLDPDAPVRGLDARQAAAAAADRLPARERRARAALDGEHGLHRHEHLVLAGRQAVAARLGALRPRPVAGRRLPGDDPGRAPDQADARPARARVVPEDERLRGDPHPRPGRAAAHVRADARVLGDRRRRARARASRARDDRVDEGEAPRRPDRLEPERRGEDDRVGRTRCGRRPARRSRRRCAGTR